MKLKLSNIRSDRLKSIFGHIIKEQNFLNQ